MGKELNENYSMKIDELENIWIDGKMIENVCEYSIEHKANDVCPTITLKIVVTGNLEAKYG